ncbi:MAG: cupin domain-containing protein [Pseudomonadales bacterium]|jgi:uncharacterized cupin superfamily protein|nr:cupin domain-containing protein [Pseudomonadales bacterium]
MTPPSNPPCLLTATTIDALPEREQVHQFDANAVRQVRSLGDLLGLTRLGVHRVRLAPGRASTTYHFHEGDEEFLFVLAGRGMAEIGEDRIEVGPGDFMAFPAGSPAHRLTNPFDEDLHYLMAGERTPLDVVRYPRDGLTMIRSGTTRRVVRDAHIENVHRADS